MTALVILLMPMVLLVKPCTCLGISKQEIWILTTMPNLFVKQASQHPIRWTRRRNTPAAVSMTKAGMIAASSMPCICPDTTQRAITGLHTLTMSGVISNRAQDPIILRCMGILPPGTLHRLRMSCLDTAIHMDRCLGL